MIEPALQSIAETAIEVGDVSSAAIFVLRPGSAVLDLVAAAGISGEPLNRLAQAVRDSNHPITRTTSEAQSSFDVAPMAPGGPALRSHLTIVDANGNVEGVLAVAHDASLDDEARAELTALADKAATELA